MGLLKKQGLWSELVAHNCLLNCVFLSCCLFGYHSHGRMPPWGCRDGKGVTVSGGTETRWYHSHINQK